MEARADRRQLEARLGGKRRRQAAASGGVRRRQVLRESAANGEQGTSQSLDSESEPQMCNSSARRLRTMNFVQFSLKRVVEKSDAGIAPQCLQDAAGSGNSPRTRCCVLHDWPVTDGAGWRTR
jgi:hypothetical protein